MSVRVFTQLKRVAGYQPSTYHAEELIDAWVDLSAVSSYTRVGPFIELWEKGFSLGLYVIGRDLVACLGVPEADL